jgi:hypothetical protein
MLTSDFCIHTYLTPPPCYCMATCCLHTFYFLSSTFYLLVQAAHHQAARWKPQSRSLVAPHWCEQPLARLYIMEVISDMGRVSSGTITSLPQHVVMNPHSTIDSSRTQREQDGGTMRTIFSLSWWLTMVISSNAIYDCVVVLVPR